jgi:Ca2+-binding EF-hand superfamily protein
MNLKPILLGAGLCALIAAVAQAEEPKADKVERETVIVMHGPGHHGRHVFLGGPGPFKKMDKNGDGQITREEFAAFHSEHFSQIDRDGDGKIEAGEMDHGPMGGPDLPPTGAGEGERHFVKHMRGPEDADTDHDGKISFEEFAAPLREAFKAADKDGSGYLEKGEQAGERRIEIRRIEKK